MIQSVRPLLAATIFLISVARSSESQIMLYRDSYGTPSIAARSLPDAEYGLGYATAMDNAERMARNYKQARGRTAEVDGKNALLADGFIRSLGIEEIAESKAKSLTGEMKAAMESFCAGANRAFVEQKGKIPAWIEPISPTDVLALAQLVNAAFPLQEIAGQLLPGAGSNQFAVAKGRSANGHAIVSTDPHLLWSGILAWYEFALYTRDFSYHGITLPGLPFGSIGHSDKVAWSMTNNSPDLWDFFIVKTRPDNPKQYNYHGEWKDFEEKSFELKYLEDGTLKSRKQTARITAWGPMVPLRPWAVRLSMLGSWELLDQIIGMSRAKDANQFRKALQPLGLSMWNCVYGDTKGNIGYQYLARVPKRDESFDWTKPVPGDDPRTKWGPLWKLDDLPHVANPKSNLLVNANSAPDLTPLGDELKPGWPKYVSSYGHTTRYDRLAEELAADSRVTVENAKKYATDTRVPYADATIHAVAASAEMDSDAKAALDVLNSWDKRADVDSKGCGLYLYWLKADRTMPAIAAKAAQGWSAEERGAAVEALKKGAESMGKDHGRLDTPWSEMHVSIRGTKTVPVSGLAYFSGDATATVAPNFGLFAGGRIQCIGGSSFRMIMDLDPKGVKSWSILPYGDSNDPKNPHFADQMELFGRGQYKDTIFGLKRIRREAVSATVLKR